MQIALVAKMRSGKDTLADYAIKKYGMTRFAFGDGIREVAKMLFPEQMVNENKPRALLQGIGQSMRQFNNYVWVNKCFNEIRKQKYSFDMGNERLIPIITDLRQPNEFKRCKDEGFVTIKIECEDEIRFKRILKNNDNFNKADLYHETEMHMESYECDYTIHNNGSLEELYGQFDEIINKINNY